MMSPPTLAGPVSARAVFRRYGTFAALRGATVAAVNARFARLRKAPDIVIVRDTDADARADG